MWREQVCPKWWLTHPRIIGTWLWVSIANIASPFGATCLYDNPKLHAIAQSHVMDVKVEMMTTMVGPYNALDCKFQRLYKFVWWSRLWIWVRWMKHIGEPSQNAWKLNNHVHISCTLLNLIKIGPLGKNLYVRKIEEISWSCSISKRFQTWIHFVPNCKTTFILYVLQKKWRTWDKMMINFNMIVFSEGSWVNPSYDRCKGLR